jgi:hypothetical protein
LKIRPFLSREVQMEKAIYGSGKCKREFLYGNRIGILQIPLKKPALPV